MRQDPAREGIRIAVARHLGVTQDKIRPDQRLESDLGLDSLDVFMIALATDRMARVGFSLDGLEAVRTVEELVELLSGPSVVSPPTREDGALSRTPLPFDEQDCPNHHR